MSTQQPTAFGNSSPINTSPALWIDCDEAVSPVDYASETAELDARSVVLQYDSATADPTTWMPTLSGCERCGEPIRMCDPSEFHDLPGLPSAEHRPPVKG
jgi:hypothetical protein